MFVATRKPNAVRADSYLCLTQWPTDKTKIREWTCPMILCHTIDDSLHWLVLTLCYFVDIVTVGFVGETWDGFWELPITLYLEFQLASFTSLYGDACMIIASCKIMELHSKRMRWTSAYSAYIAIPAYSVASMKTCLLLQYVTLWSMQSASDVCSTTSCVYVHPRC